MSYGLSQSLQTRNSVMKDALKGAFYGIAVILFLYSWLVFLGHGCSAVFGAELIDVRPSNNRTITGENMELPDEPIEKPLAGSGEC